MPIQLVTALIALVGVVVSALVAWSVSRRTINAQLRGVRLQLQQHQLQLLQQKRLNEYQGLHQAVRAFVRAVQQRQATFDGLKGLQQTTARWDSDNSLILGAQATGVVYRYERLLRQLVEKGEAAFANRLASRDMRLRLIRRCFEVEIALKNDLGIYQIEFAEPGKKFKSYDEVALALEGSDDDE